MGKSFYEALEQLEILKKERRLSSGEAFQLQSEIAGAQFLLEASDDDRIELRTLAAGPSASAGLAKMVALGALAHLDSAGVTRENAREYIKGRIRAIELATKT